MKMRVIQVRGSWKDYVDIHALASHGIDLPTALAAAIAIDTSFNPATSTRALQFYGDGTLDRIPVSMRKDLTPVGTSSRFRKVAEATLPAWSKPGRNGSISLSVPYPAELLRVARKVVWYAAPDRTLADLKTFLAHLMVYGSSADVAVTNRYIPIEEFRGVLEDAPAGVFTQEAWKKWHEQFGMTVPPMPRRRFPDGSLGPEPGDFFGR